MCSCGAKMAEEDQILVLKKLQLLADRVRGASSGGLDRGDRTELRRRLEASRGILEVRNFTKALDWLSHITFFLDGGRKGGDSSLHLTS